MGERIQGEKEVLAAIEGYMLKVNRPYNATSLHLNLRQAIAKPQIVKALSTLTAKEVLVEKVRHAGARAPAWVGWVPSGKGTQTRGPVSTRLPGRRSEHARCPLPARLTVCAPDAGQEYGKQKIYVANQAKMPVPDPDEMQQLKTKTGVAKAALDQLDQQCTDASRELARLNAEPRDPELESRVTELTAEVAAQDERLDKLRAGAEQISEADKKKIEADYGGLAVTARAPARLFGPECLVPAPTELRPHAVCG